MRTFDVAGLIQALLLRSGDVELNPGPVTAGPLKPRDASNVESELVGVATKWKELGIHLGLSTSWLDELDKDPLTCLRDVIQEWLLRADLFPMWCTITRALESVGEQELASKLNDKFCNKDGPLSEDQSRSRVRMQRPRIQGCGFKNCKCAALIDASQLLERASLPYFDTESHPDGEAHKEKLLLEYKEMVYAFQGLLSITWRSLTRRFMTPAKLVDYLESLDGTTSNELPSVALFFQIMANLRDDQSVGEIFVDCHEYYSYFNHILIKGILLKLCATIENKRVLSNFEEKFSYFSKRKVIEVPPMFMTPSRHGHTCISVKVHHDPRHATINDVELFRQRLAELLKLRVYALRLIYIKVEEGMMVQMYQFPWCLRPGLFPLTEQQETQLRRDRVLTLTCCDYEFNAENLDPDHGEEVMKDLPEGRQHADNMQGTEEDILPPSSTIAISDEAMLEKVVSSLSETDYKMSLKWDSVTKSQLSLARPGMEEKNYVSIVPKLHDKLVVFGLILSQHISHKLSAKQQAKVVVVAGTKPHSEELHKELTSLLPKANIELFTGAKEESMTTKLCLSQPTILVCTAGKLYHELQSKAVHLDIITLLVMDDFHMALMNTSLRDVLQYYLHSKINYKLNGPHMVGVMCFPGEGFVALTIDDMRERLLNMCAIINANGGMTTPGNYPQGDSPKDTHFSVTTFKFRDSKRDFVAHLAVEMGHLEDRCEFTCPFEKWSPAYSSFVQAHRDTLLAVSTADTISSHLPTVSYLELLLCCAKAMNVCREFGCEDAVQVLRRHSISESSSRPPDSPFKDAEHALVMLQAELQKIVTRKNPIFESVAENLTSQFSQSPLSKGIIFVDSLKEGRFLCEEIKKIPYHVRPSIIDHVYVIRDSNMDSSMETDSSPPPTHELNILKNFIRAECRLLIIPFPIETDKEKLQLPSCNFLLRLCQVANTTTMLETEYILTSFASSATKPCSKLLEDLQLVLMEAVLKDHPFKKQTNKMVSRRQRTLVQDYLAQTRIPLVPPRKNTNKSPAEKFILKCKKCKTFACKGKDIYTLFADGGQFYVVPNRDFRFRFMTKVYRSQHKTIKRISRQHKVLCSNCDSRWGTICYFPTRRCVLPVIKSKYFVFEMDQKLHLVKIWQHVPFYVPPITACTFFRSLGTSPPSDSE